MYKKLSFNLLTQRTIFQWISLSCIFLSFSVFYPFGFVLDDDTMRLPVYPPVREFTGKF